MDNEIRNISSIPRFPAVLTLASCCCQAVSVQVVRADALSLGCDGLVTGPPGFRNPLPWIFPEYFETAEHQYGKSNRYTPSKDCPRWWVDSFATEALLPSVVPAPAAASPLKHVGIVLAKSEALAPIARSVRETLGILVGLGCEAIAITNLRKMKDEATAIVEGLRDFAERNPSTSLRVFLCDRTDGKQFAERLHLLFLQNRDLWR